MTLTDRQRQYLTAARVARLATADTAGRPHVVPICFTLHDSDMVTSLDEEPKHKTSVTFAAFRTPGERLRGAGG
jgi:nitroimidazol reductase NimA-like FMN-containing flavoprotein (pyridoxamine 5'-phosphate oxidase superfamily)